MAIPAIVGIGLGASLLGSGARFIKGMQQHAQANGINPVRPTYEIPEEYEDNVELFQNMANASKAPGQVQAEQMLEQQSASTAYRAKNATTSSNNLISVLTNIDRNSKKARLGLQQSAADYRARAIHGLSQANAQLANAKDQEFDYNHNQPYQYQMRQKNMLQNAGNQNKMAVFDTVSDLGNTAMTYGVAKMMNS